LWKDLAERSIIIDVYVANAAKFSEPKTIFELGADEVWSQVEVNAKSPLYFAEKFNSQQSSKQKVYSLRLTTLRILSTPFLCNERI
jgi:hypothetical protein